MAEETIPWWRRALKFALGGIRSGFGLFSRTAAPEPPEAPENSGKIEESSLEAGQNSPETGQLEAAQEKKPEAVQEEKAEEERALTESFPQSEVLSAEPATPAAPMPAIEAAPAPEPAVLAQDSAAPAPVASHSEANLEAEPLPAIAVAESLTAEPAPALEAEAEPEEEVLAAAPLSAEAEAVEEPVADAESSPEEDAVPAILSEPEPEEQAAIEAHLEPIAAQEPELAEAAIPEPEAILPAAAEPAAEEVAVYVAVVDRDVEAVSQVEPIESEREEYEQVDAVEAEPESASVPEPEVEPEVEAEVEPAAQLAEVEAAQSPEPAPEPLPEPLPEPNPEPIPEQISEQESAAAAVSAAGEAPLVLTPHPTSEEAAAKKAAEREAARLAARQKKLDEGAEQSPFSVFVGQVYDGPLDLLLDLIRKQDIDIYDIPIAKITAQFLAYVNQLKASDVDVAGEFIYTASLLIHIKSKMLLPRAATGPEDAAEDPRRELVERLLEHERFKNAAQMLQEKQMLEAASWTNPGLREFKGDEATEPEIAADTVDLVRIFREILERAKKRPIFNVDEDSVTVGQMIQFLGRRLTMDDKPVALRRLLSHTRSERALIAMFLALLELVRLQAILLRQDRAFSEIFIKKSTGFDAVMNEGLLNARDDWK